ncbi:hypothetical protein [Stieleria mannarensis]|uniref:hypothetical protein n=1 Tax=Stieleria mannarensis TaxID=2755585 RepID=UPI0016006056|nr:hypothetical protein [Rhodopirellula sp. JC639]
MKRLDGERHEGKPHEAAGEVDNGQQVPPTLPKVRARAGVLFAANCRKPLLGVNRSGKVLSRWASRSHDHGAERKPGSTKGCTTSGEVRVLEVVHFASPPRDPYRYLFTTGDSLANHPSNPYQSPDDAVSTELPSPRFVRAKQWAIRAALVTGTPAVLIVAPVLLHELGVAMPRAIRLFSPKTPLFIMYPEMIVFPSAILAWLASWVFPITENDWTLMRQNENGPR